MSNRKYIRITSIFTLNFFSLSAILAFTIFLTGCGFKTSLWFGSESETAPVVPTPPSTSVRSPFNVATNMGPTRNSDVATAVVTQADGKILVGGQRAANGFMIARLDVNGNPDLTFGTGGRIITRAGLPYSWEELYALIIQPDGKIIAVGTTSPDGIWGPFNFALVRLNTDGTLDSTFGVGGKVVTDIDNGSDEKAKAVALQADGKIVVTGSFIGADADFAVVRYNSNGSIDSTFGAAGKVILDLAGAQPDAATGVLIQTDGKIVVTGHTGAAGAEDFAAARLDTTGALDATFGTGGVSIFDLGTGQSDISMTALMQPDGKIVQAGYVDSATPDFAMFRYNADGTIDTSFGTNGIVIQSFAGGTTELAYGMIRQPDGKFVLGGYSNAGGSWDFAAMRFDATGVIDGTFGAAGKLTTNFKTGPNSYDKGYAVAIAPDGKIVIVGETTANSDYDFGIARYTTGGALDASFGSGGKVTIDGMGDSDDTMSAMVKQPDGKIVMVGTTNSIANRNFNLVRYNTNGTLDTSFGSAGIVITDLNPGIESADAIAAMVLQPDGKIVVTGTIYNTVAFGPGDFVTARYNSDGTIDTTFGTAGKVITSIGSGWSEQPSGIIVQVDGKIVVSGTSDASGGNDFVLVRYTAAGVLDGGFGTGGIVTTDVGTGSEDYAYGMVQQPDGRFIVGGSTSASSDDDFVLVRYLANGTIDTTFGTNGRVITDVGAGSDEDINNLVLQPDGKILAGGYSNVSGDQQLTIIRYTANGLIDTTFGVSGIYTEIVGTGSTFVSALAVQPDGKILIAVRDYDSNVVVIRCSAQGVLDTDFAVAGKYILDISGDNSLDNVRELIVENDGQILIGGDTSDPFGQQDFSLIRINQSGR